MNETNHTEWDPAILELRAKYTPDDKLRSFLNNIEFEFEIHRKKSYLKAMG